MEIKYRVTLPDSTVLYPADRSQVNKKLRHVSVPKDLGNLEAEGVTVEKVKDPGLPAHNPAVSYLFSEELVPSLDPEFDLEVSYTMADWTTEQQNAHALEVLKHDAVSGFLTDVHDITEQYTQEERDSWPVQEAEATAWLADSSALTPFIDAMIVETGETKLEIATRIKAKADAFKLAVGTALGKKRKLEADGV